MVQVPEIEQDHYLPVMAAAAVDALSFEGVLLLAKRNKKHRFFLAGRQNSFGGFVVGPVMLDTGCNSLLLPLQEKQLATLGTLFPIADYRFGIAFSKGVSSKSHSHC